MPARPQSRLAGGQEQPERAGREGRLLEPARERTPGPGRRSRRPAARRTRPPSSTGAAGPGRGPPPRGLEPRPGLRDRAWGRGTARSGGAAAAVSDRDGDSGQGGSPRVQNCTRPGGPALPSAGRHPGVLVLVVVRQQASTSFVPNRTHVPVGRELHRDERGVDQGHQPDMPEQLPHPPAAHCGPGRGRGRSNRPGTGDWAAETSATSSSRGGYRLPVVNLRFSPAAGGGTGVWEIAAGSGVFPRPRGGRPGRHAAARKSDRSRASPRATQCRFRSRQTPRSMSASSRGPRVGPGVPHGHLGQAVVGPSGRATRAGELAQRPRPPDPDPFLTGVLRT